MEQRSFEFDRGRKLRALERAVLPKLVRLPGRNGKPGKGISDKAMYAVLTALDKCARQADTCRVTLSDLAGLARLSEDHCGRTVQALELIFLVAVTDRFAQKRREASEYRVIWGNLETLVQADPRLSQTDLGLSQTDLGSERYSYGFNTGNKNTTTSQTARSGFEQGGFEDGGGGEIFIGTKAKTVNAGDAWFVGWLSAEDFKGRENVDRLFERMVSAGQGGLTAEDRELFYAVRLCLTREKREGKIKSPLAVFRWLFSSDRDRWALRPTKVDRDRARALSGP